SKPSILNSSDLGSKNFIKLSEAKLQAVLSKNMYSEHGFEALILPPSGQVCQSLIVSSNCTPGSAQAHAASAMSFHTFSAGILAITLPSVLAISSQSSPFSSLSKNFLGIRTELFEF